MVVLFVGLYAFAVRTRRGQAADSWVNNFLHNLIGYPYDRWVGELARDLGPTLSAVVVVPLAVGAALRRRWRSLVAATMIAAVPVAAWLLRRSGPDRPELGVVLPHVNTYPSTHAAIVASACAAAAFLWHRQGHPIVIMFLAFTAVLGALGNVLSHAHLPSDVLGSLLMTGAAAAAAAAMTGESPLSRVGSTAVPQRGRAGVVRSGAQDGR
ncbi:phosphatase PAP2 family protein [Yimella sp. cx-51]|uniref:phosphatase PAP2 family protein n=1 Tax=Yimella sp. cx-51 TaxID=2770551 RepID=UPI00165D9BA5|nr:phosphatase PAP2 family protein [Yimella sp. cx-51]MBC9958204.1 phosphatase PAP2 family protein [Yimella sp. cx-51]QTH38762.1 phosphatase PAP2 family protein [Yimella sp. cx-51]